MSKLDYPKTCWLEAIFARQNELREKYHRIELANGFKQPETVPVNINDRFDQAIIKDMAWRFTEELAEAHDCLEPYRDGTNMWKDCPDVAHFREELIDALHFLTELSILIDVGPGELAACGSLPSCRLDDLLLYDHEAGEVIVDDLHQKAFEAIMYLGLACNQLKNKPWKQMRQITDEYRFKKLIHQTWEKFFELLNMAGFDSPLVYDLYTRKAEVNQFRQNTGY